MDKSVPYYFEPAPPVQYNGIFRRLLEQCIIALSYHLSVQFLDIDVQEISRKHPENSGNLLSQTGFYFSEIYILRLIFIS
jgi:hypothetical protein